MNIRRIIGVVSITALPFAGMVFADEPEGRQGEGGKPVQPGSLDMTGEQGSTPSHYQIVPVRRGEIKDVEGSPLEDAKVINQQGKPLGTLEKLLMDEKTGKIEYGVVSLTDTDQLVPLPWSSFKVKKDSGQVVLNATKDQLEPQLNASETQDRSPDMKYYIKEIEKMRSQGKTQMPGLGIQKQPAAGGGSGEDKAATGGPSGPRADPPGKAPGFEGGK